MKATEKKPAYGNYKPSAQKQAHIDELIRKAIGKGVAVEACIGTRNLYSKKGESQRGPRSSRKPSTSSAICSLTKTVGSSSRET